MGDIGWIADALAEEAARGTAVVLATVVRTAGSTYRRVGARLVVDADGTTLGIVSGGCLEPDLALRAQGVLAAGVPALATYDTSAGDDEVWGLGLGCNGRVDVLLEPLEGDALAQAAALYASCRDVEHPAVVSTVFGVPSGAALRSGAHVLLADTPDGGPSDESLRDVIPPALREAFAAGARAALRAGRSAVARYPAAGAGDTAAGSDDAGFDVLHEVVAPQVALLVCGAGPDAVPVVRFATALGWRVTVADDRPAYTHPERFAGAAVLALAPGEAATTRWPGRRTPSRGAAVVMSHHYARDRGHLADLLAADLAYVGVLGPRRRTAQLFAELDGVVPDAAAALARVHAPVGLDLGADTPDEIALSIVAEVAGVMAARPARPLRDRDGGIHEPDRSRCSEPVARAAS